MTYKLILMPDAIVFYERIFKSDRKHFDRIKTALESLKQEPRKGKPLRFDFKGCYSLRVGFYRIIYQVNKHEVMVIILDIGHRKEIYRS